ncbi:MAG: bifunctional tetrahydrofolate synthase/dihydrofolate synthase [Methylophilaceae bacterium]
MIDSTPKPVTLDAWLAYIEALHPKSIAMGLERVQLAANRLKLNPTFPIITIAGTNGKGSTCAILEAIYLNEGYRVGCYTSPHLLRYNERVRVNQQQISDEDLCAAFAAVENVRGEIELTYFEMGTLAAVWHFIKVGLDVAVLEVGMGGRLDAVNVFEPACAIVTSIDLDHMEYLGDTREKIGFEKAGIYRTGKLAICGDENPPKSLIDFATAIGANLQLIGRDFGVKKAADSWQYFAENINLKMPYLAMHGDFQLNNAACVLRTVAHLDELLPVSQANIHKALRKVTLIGRFYQTQSKPNIYVDVAHNPQAAQSLAHNLQTTPCEGCTLAVFAMLADKDIGGVINALKPHISAWYLADIHNVRGAKADDLKRKLNEFVAVKTYENVASALKAACKDAVKNDRIIVFGSFYTVADAIESLNLKV